MSDFKETCIWMSYRYAIGRHTIASTTHAYDIMRHLDWIPENRRDFTAFDIIREINDRVHWWKNIHVDGFENQDNPICIFDIIFEWFMENPQMDDVKYFMEHEWYINMYQGTLDIEERDETNKPVKTTHGTYIEPDVFNEYSDYVGWIHLAKLLKGATHIATVEYEGETKEMDVIELFHFSNWGGEFILEKCYHSLDRNDRWHINPDYIKDVKLKQ